MMRRASLFLLVLFLASLGLRDAMPQGHEPTKPSASSLCTPTRGTIQQNVFGINAGRAKEELPFVKDLGVRWVRSDMYWSDIEPVKGTYKWGYFDGLVNELTKSDIQLLAIINNPPDWAWAKATDDGAKEAGQFAQTIVNRYKGNVRYWEVFNEPNLPGMGFHREREKVDVGKYYAYLSEVNRGIRRADPNAVIVLGGLSPDGMSPAHFLPELYRLGGKDCFDIIAFHPYGGRFKETAIRIRNFASVYRDANKPIWFNEFGTDNDPQRVGLMKQAATEISEVQGFFWFSLRDQNATSERYGLLTFDYKKKQPDYDFFKHFAKSKK